MRTMQNFARDNNTHHYSYQTSKSAEKEQRNVKEFGQEQFSVSFFQTVAWSFA